MKDNHVAVLLEDISSKMDGVAEVVGGLRDQVAELDKRLTRVEQNTDLIPAIQAAVRDQTRELADHDSRLSNLEEATT